MNRTTLAKVLLVVAIAIPVIIEGITFFGLFGQHFGSANDAATPTPDALGVGEDLLSGVEGSEAAATIESGSIQASDDGWLFTVSINVANHGNSPTRVTFGPVTTGEGTVLEQTVTSDRLSKNGTDSVVAQWTLPSGETPRSIEVALRGEDRAAIEQTVRIGGFAVQQD
ncbi:hypothetical protein [Halorhabdus rudnickae]|uniref:hypothetical protein n=1 Tax=Halorhabdus rudnickae TaxID=1775544 RepID=UPI001082EAFE|nr:hypothetical protein [Halorhabdus rudnickae]